jgi:hypothetical protein
MITKSYIITATFDESKTRFREDDEIIRIKLACQAATILEHATSGQVPHCEAMPISSPVSLAALAACEAAQKLTEAYALPCPECGGVETHTVWCNQFVPPLAKYATSTEGGDYARN